MLLLWYLYCKLFGELLGFRLMFTYGWSEGFGMLAQSMPGPSAQGLSYILMWSAYAICTQLYVPGKTVYGPVSPKGNVPAYTANGFQCYVLTLALFLGGWRFGAFNPAGVYDELGNILFMLNVGAIVMCLVLQWKGLHAPSSSDCGSSGSLLYDFYWGTELYPRIGDLDIKTFTNCRFGMMGWGVLILCYAAKQAEDHGQVFNSMFVSVFLQHVYIAKFFLWEAGYWKTMDIAHDRAGFYICWGCMVWVPILYTSPALYLVHNTITLSPTHFTALLTMGLFAIFVNYDADRQRQAFRASDGKTKIWGEPPIFIEAYYVTSSAHIKKSLLLVSGWWGISRHFHYVPEILGALAWSLPGLYRNPSPYFYVIFLTGLLVHRAVRDDVRCLSKYGKWWGAYCELVPYKLVPYVW